MGYTHVTARHVILQYGDRILISQPGMVTRGMVTMGYTHATARHVVADRLENSIIYQMGVKQIRRSPGKQCHVCVIGAYV